MGVQSVSSSSGTAPYEYLQAGSKCKEEGNAAVRSEWWEEAMTQYVLALLVSWIVDDELTVLQAVLM